MLTTTAGPFFASSSLIIGPNIFPNVKDMIYSVNLEWLLLCCEAWNVWCGTLQSFCVKSCSSGFIRRIACKQRLLAFGTVFLPRSDIASIREWESLIHIQCVPFSDLHLRWLMRTSSAPPSMSCERNGTICLMFGLASSVLVWKWPFPDLWLACFWLCVNQTEKNYCRSFNLSVSPNYLYITKCMYIV